MNMKTKLRISGSIAQLAAYKSQFLWIGIKVIVGVILLVSFHVFGLSIKSYFLKMNNAKNTGTVALIAVAKVSYITCVVIAALLILRLFGVEIASIIAIISAFAFVVGMSLQGTLSDISSGFILALFQTYNIGDVIEIVDHEKTIIGKVVEFRFVNTIVQDIYSGVRVTIPNRKVQESIIRNYSSTETHMVITDILLSNTNKDFDNIIQVLKTDLESTDKYPAIIRDPNLPLNVFIYDMGEVGTKMRVVTPITIANILPKRAQIKTGIRNTLAKINAILVDPF